MIVGLFIIFTAIVLVVYYFIVYRYGVHTVGDIIGYEGASKRGKRYYYPMIRYQNEAGETIEQRAFNSKAFYYFEENGRVKIVVWKGKVFTKSLDTYVMFFVLLLIGLGVLSLDGAL